MNSSFSLSHTSFVRRLLTRRIYKLSTPAPDKRLSYATLIPVILTIPVRPPLRLLLGSRLRRRPPPPRPSGRAPWPQPRRRWRGGARHLMPTEKPLKRSPLRTP